MRKCACSLLALLFACSQGIALDRQSNSDYHARREALAKKAAGAVILFAPLAPTDSEYTFRQDDNFYYLSGVTEPGGALLIAPAIEANGDFPAHPYTEILFLPPHNLRMEKFIGPKLGAENPDAPKITGFDRVEDMEKLPDEASKVLFGGRPVLYTDVASQGETSASAEPLMFLKRTNAFVSFQDVKPMLSSLRTNKDEGDLVLIRKAEDATVAPHLAAMTTLNPTLPD